MIYKVRHHIYCQFGCSVKIPRPVYFSLAHIANESKLSCNKNSMIYLILNHSYTFIARRRWHRQSEGERKCVDSGRHPLPRIGLPNHCLLIDIHLFVGVVNNGDTAMAVGRSRTRVHLLSVRIAFGDVLGILLCDRVLLVGWAMVGPFNFWLAEDVNNYGTGFYFLSENQANCTFYAWSWAKFATVRIIEVDSESVNFSEIIQNIEMWFFREI